MGGCPMIAQTFVNLNAGARARLSGIVAALTILLIILVGAPVIGKLPVAALTGVMMMVAITTFEWSSFKVINKMPKADIIIGMLVAAITIVFHNLALAVLAGVIISALVFAWQSAVSIHCHSFTDPEATKHYKSTARCFWGGYHFTEKFSPKTDPEKIIIDFKESTISDMSAIEALNNLTKKYSANKTVYVKNLNPQSLTLLHKAGDLISVNLLTD
jgi:SulP family sulfate permease